MALSDYIANKPQTGIPFTEKAPAINTLAAVDTQMRDAQQAAQIRGRREELQTKIANLEAQNDELRARRDKIKANSLSDMDEDKVVAMAKAKGIKNDDIEAWLRGRTARTNREISLGQKEELGKQAEAEAKKATAIEKANKEARKQAILEARKAYETANKPVEPEEYESKVSELDSLEFTFNNLKDSNEEDYKEKLDYTLTPRKVQATPPGGAPKTDKIPPIPADVELTEDQRREWNKPTTTKDQRDKIVAQIRDKANAEADKKEKEEKALEENRAGIKNQAKNKNLSKESKSALITKYRNTFPEGKKPTRDEIRKILFGE
ncbi:MAG: hypothetical protein II265_04470 [Clostridia bacterium]|nr:hypothetical protein [Clostridia bacterium]